MSFAKTQLKTGRKKKNDKSQRLYKSMRIIPRIRSICEYHNFALDSSYNYKHDEFQTLKILYNDLKNIYIFSI